MTIPAQPNMNLAANFIRRANEIAKAQSPSNKPIELNGKIHKVLAEDLKLRSDEWNPQVGDGEASFLATTLRESGFEGAGKALVSLLTDPQAVASLKSNVEVSPDAKALLTAYSNDRVVLPKALYSAEEFKEIRNQIDWENPKATSGEKDSEMKLARGKTEKLHYESGQQYNAVFIYEKLPNGDMKQVGELTADERKALGDSKGLEVTLSPERLEKFSGSELFFVANAQTSYSVAWDHITNWGEHPTTPDRDVLNPSLKAFQARGKIVLD